MAPRFVLVGVILAAPALAEPATAETAALSWVLGEGAESCPPESDVARAIAERLGRPTLVAREQADLVVEARLSAMAPRGFRVGITLLRGDEVVGRRDLESESPSCEDAAENAALVIALTIDPEASLEPVAIAAPAEPAEPSPPVAAPASVEPPKPAPRVAPAPAPVVARWQGDLEVAAGVVSGTVPNVGVALSARGRALPPALPFGVELEGAFIPAQSVDVAPGKGADLAAFHVGVALCSRPSRASPLWGAVCAGANAGALHGQAYGFDVTPPFSSFTAELTARGRLGFRVVPSLAVVVGPNLEIPLKRDHFEVQTGGTTLPLFRSSAVGLGFELGVVWEL